MAQPEDPVKACRRRRFLFFIVLEVKPNLHQIFRHIIETQITGTNWSPAEPQEHAKEHEQWYGKFICCLLAGVMRIIVGMA
jgi:hypothetical protein